MSSDSSLDDPNDQLEDIEVASNAPKASDDGENGAVDDDDLFGDGDDEPTETVEPTMYGRLLLAVEPYQFDLD